jgi:hypothetical protein
MFGYRFLGMAFALIAEAGYPALWAIDSSVFVTPVLAVLDVGLLAAAPASFPSRC